MATDNISFSGLASGLDTGAIVKALVGVAEIPINRLTSKKLNYNSQKSRISALSSFLSSLQTTAKTMDTESEFKAYSATVATTDQAYLTAAASTSATPGTYAIKVNALAAAERTYSDAFSSKSTAGLVGTGNLTIQVGTGTAKTLTFDANDTLETVAAEINSSIDDVSAGIVYDGSQYRLLVSGTKTGTSNAITFTEDATLNLDLDDSANEALAADNAEIEFDGHKVTSETNKFSSAIPGVTVEAKKVTASGSSISVVVSEDLDTIVKNVQDMVNSFNKVASFIKNEFTYSKGMNGQAKLMGDASVRNTQYTIKGTLTGTVAAATDKYNALSRIGVTSQKDGSMKVDATILKAALADDLDGVTKLFTYTDSDNSTDNDGIMIGLIRDITGIVQTPDGILAGRQKGIDMSIRSIDNRISSLQRSLETYETGLKKKFTALEGIMAGLQNTSNFITQKFYASTAAKKK